MKKQFPILEQAPYLNHAAVGPWPRCTAQAVRDFARENMLRGSSDYLNWYRREQQLRGLLAQLTGASSGDDIALLKNTSEGISLVAWGVDWKPGENVVIPVGEFPSNRLPWVAQAERGVETREVDIRAADEPEQALLAAMDGQTRLLSVSSVQWSDGFRLDIKRLGAECKKRGVLFFVDAIQQLGALPMDVADAQVDFLAADAHKWLLAPEGIAVFYCSPSARKQLSLTQQGWHMFDKPWEFERKDWTPSVTARRFEAGSPNTMGQAALHASANLLLDYGMDFVGRRVLDNTACLISELGALPAIRVSSRTELARRSGIVSFKHADLPVADIYRRLKEKEISCVVRGDSIRLSPHFYQGERELGMFIDALKRVVSL